MIAPVPKALLFCFAALSLFPTINASAEVGQIIPMGDLERWAAFSLGTEWFGNTLSDNALVQGDFGAAGNGIIVLTGNSTINGDIYYRSNGTLMASPTSSHNGLTFNNQDALLDNGFDEAITASSAAAALPATRSRTQVDLIKNRDITLSGAPGETVVLNLKSFQMSGNSTFTLQGSANTTYIINVKNQFSLSGNAAIVLSGGLSWNDVLFNVRGKGEPVHLDGSSRFNGILLANKRTVRLRDQAILTGEVIAGQLVAQGTSQIIHPPIVSP